MKIKIDDKSIVALKEMKENIEELLKMDSEEIEFNENNLKKAKEISERLYRLEHVAFNVGGLRLTIEGCDGTKFLIM